MLKPADIDNCHSMPHTIICQTLGETLNQEVTTTAFQTQVQVVSEVCMDELHSNLVNVAGHA